MRFTEAPKEGFLLKCLFGGTRASFLSFLIGEKQQSVAKERLATILAHERSGRNAAEPNDPPDLQRDRSPSSASTSRSVLTDIKA